jgi:hypothetical protein
VIRLKTKEAPHRRSVLICYKVGAVLFLSLDDLGFVVKVTDNSLKLGPHQALLIFYSFSRKKRKGFHYLSF